MFPDRHLEKKQMAGLVIARQHFGFLRHARFLGAKSQILGVGSQDDARLLRIILDRPGLCVGARKSF
jgi:hypothetical protein